MMKILYAPLTFVWAILMVSCSSDDDLIERITPAQWSREVTDSDVKIQLSTGSKTTKASITSDENGLFNAKGMSVFCLATDYINPSTITIDWKKGSDGFKYSVWVNNVQINAKIDKNNEKTNLTWDDDNARWYPSGSWHKYAFYGYYPRVADENISYSSTKITATIPLDGTQDVIYGEASSTDLKAYSREYFEQRQHKYEIPAMSFAHKFMRFKFQIAAGSYGNNGTVDALNSGVKKIEVLNVPSEVNLVIADRENSRNNGAISFTPDMNNSYELKTDDAADGITSLFTHKDNDETTPLAYWVPSEWSKFIGQGILVPVPTADNHYYVRVTLVNKKGEEFVSAPTLIKNTKDFVAGRSYRIRLTIRGTNSIQSTVDN